MDSLSHDERSTYQKSGNLPDRIGIKETSSGKSSPAVSAEPNPATAGLEAPASETGTSATDTTEKPKGLKLKARTDQLAEENRQLQEQLRIRHALREELARTERPVDDKPAASSTAKPATQAEYDRYLAMPDAPQEADFDSYAKFTAAMSLFIGDKRFEERQAQSRTESSVRQSVDGVKAWAEGAQKRIQDYSADKPGFAESINPQLLEIESARVRRLMNQPVTPSHELVDLVMDSDYTGQLLEHFSTEQGIAEWQQLVRLPSENARSRAVGRLEARFVGTPAGGSGASAPKYVSSAPGPATTVGSRPSDTADALESAIKSKDAARYAREATKRELAALKG